PQGLPRRRPVAGDRRGQPHRRLPAARRGIAPRDPETDVRRAMAGQPSDVSLPAVSVAVNGAALPVAVALQLSAASVDEEAGLPSMFALDIAGGDADDETANIDGDLFAVVGGVAANMGQPAALQT